MDEVIPTKEERITKIVNALKTTPKGKLSYDRDPSSPPILALSPKTENKERIDQPKEPQPSADYYTIDIDPEDVKNSTSFSKSSGEDDEELCQRLRKMWAVDEKEAFILLERVALSQMEGMRKKGEHVDNALTAMEIRRKARVQKKLAEKEEELIKKSERAKEEAKEVFKIRMEKYYQKEEALNEEECRQIDECQKKLIQDRERQREEDRLFKEQRQNQLQNELKALADQQSAQKRKQEEEYRQQQNAEAARKAEESARKAMEEAKKVTENARKAAEVARELAAEEEKKKFQEQARNAAKEKLENEKKIIQQASHISTSAVPPQSFGIENQQYQDQGNQQSVNSVQIYCSKANLERSSSIKSFKISYKEKLRNIEGGQCPEIKFAIQKRVTTTVNAIAGHSSEHMKDKLNKLIHLLSGDQSIPVSGDVTLSKDYASSLLAAKFVKQGEVLVSNKRVSDEGFPGFIYAAIITGI